MPPHARGEYDPRKMGARCDLCPLGPNGPEALRGKAEWQPVGPERGSAQVIAVAECPSDEEVRQGRPLVGPAGRAWESVLPEGWGRADIALTNVVACKPPGVAAGAYGRFERKLSKYNKARAAEGMEGHPGSMGGPWPHPRECCAPRLESELRDYRFCITLGGTAAKAVAGDERSILDIRGGPLERARGGGLPPLQIMPTVSPGMILKGRNPKFAIPMRSDVAKGLRWFFGGLAWRLPWIDIRPTPAALRRYLAQGGVPFWVGDFETTGREPLRVDMRCLAISTPHVWGACWVCEGSGKLQPDMAASWQAYWAVARRDESGSGVYREWEDNALNHWRAGLCPVCSGKGRPVGGPVRRAVVIPLFSVGDHPDRADGRRCFYSAAEWEEIRGIVADAFTDGRQIVGHNWRIYDWPVFERCFGRAPRPNLDTLALARLRWPELSKSLGFQGSIDTDAPSWKADEAGAKIALESKDDLRLHIYAVSDTAVNADIVPPLLEAVKARGQADPLPEELRPPSWKGRPWTLSAVDHASMDFCRGLHRVGIYVDQARRREHAARLQKEIDARLTRCQATAFRAGVTGPKRKKYVEPFNPNSTDQLAELLFEKWDLVPVRYTDTDQPSTDDESLRTFIMSPKLDPERREFLYEVRLYRRAVKAKGTFIDPLCLESEWKKEEERIKWERKQEKRVKKGLFAEEEADAVEGGLAWDSDGRVHAFWNILPAPGRYNCRNNNQANVPKVYRDIYTPAPGRRYVSCDVSQFHLVIIANHWRIPALVTALKEDIKPHNLMAEYFYGDKYRKAEGWEDGYDPRKKPKEKNDAGRMTTAYRSYSLGKILRYTGAYGGQPKNRRTGEPGPLYFAVTEAEDEETGRLLCPDMTPDEVEALYLAWMGAEPEWKDAWDQEMDAFNRLGFSRSLVLGRRCDFLDGGGLSDVANWPILSTEADILRLIEADILSEIPFEKWGPGTGIINQMHDSITVECPDDPAVVTWVRGVMAEAFTRRIPGWEIPITGDLSDGKNLKEV